MDKFLEMYYLPRLYQKEMENVKDQLWNWSSDKKDSQQTKVLDQMASHKNSVKQLKKS